MPVVGADEAGKGPVLGSMFAAAVRVTDPAALPNGLDDSKSLAPAERERLDAALRDDDRITIALAEVGPGRIDDERTDMNSLTVAAHAAALAGLARPGDRILLDAGDVSAGRFARRVGEHLDGSFELHAEHGADATYAVVSAASVVAKVARDAHVARLAEEFGELGSGYPSDPATRSFLRTYVDEHGCLPDCARTSWRTSEDALAAADQAGLEEF
jgi:ribonuclease HII